MSKQKQQRVTEISSASSDDQKPSADDQKPSAEEIARRAYSLYEWRGRADGADLEDWLQAERELTQNKSD